MECARHDDHRPPRCIAGASIAFVAIAAAIVSLASSAVAAGALDRVRTANRLTLGYETGVQPFSYADLSGKPVGYSIALCQKVADAVKSALKLPALNIEWVPVNLANRFQDVQSGKIDLICGADSATLSRRKDVAFSIPIFAGGIGAMLRADAPAALRELLAQGSPATHPIWRGSPARNILEKKTFSVVAGTTGEPWLAGRLQAFQVDATVAPVSSYEAGVERLLNRTTDVFFGDRPILIEAAKRSRIEDVVILDRLFTHEPLALVLARGDEDLRLLVDTTLSHLFGTAEIETLYTTWFGRPDDTTRVFFQLVRLPD